MRKASPTTVESTDVLKTLALAANERYRDLSPAID
jgi:hypothetical protein